MKVWKFVIQIEIRSKNHQQLHKYHHFREKTANKNMCSSDPPEKKSCKQLATNFARKNAPTSLHQSREEVSSTVGAPLPWCMPESVGIRIQRSFWSKVAVPVVVCEYAQNIKIDSRPLTFGKLTFSVYLLCFTPSVPEGHPAVSKTNA